MKRIFVFLAVFFVLYSCRPYIEGGFEAASPSSGYDFPRIFEDFWNGMNRNYVYWDLEPGPNWAPMLAQLPAETREFILDHPASFWDRIYDYYKPKFNELGTFAYNVSPGFDEALGTAKAYFTQIADGLLDGHFSVHFEDASYLPAQTRLFVKTFVNNTLPGANAVFHASKLLRETVTVTTNIETLGPDIYDEDNYFVAYDFVHAVLSKYMSISGDDYTIVTAGEFPALAPTGPWKLVAGEINCQDGIIPYLFTNYCFFTNAFDPDPDPALTLEENKAGKVQSVVRKFFTSLTKPNVKGVIVDVRGNMGGNPADPSFLFRRMIDKPHTYAYSRSKSGEGRLDYSPWMPVRIMPALQVARLKNLNVPIVLLADRGTFSGAEFHTMIVKTMPNGIVVGERTAGSASNTVDSLIYNGGAFSAGTVVKQVAGSVVQYRCADGNIYEGIGIPPDIDVPMDRSEWENFFGGTKTDKRLKAAIKQIDSGYNGP